MADLLYLAGQWRRKRRDRGLSLRADDDGEEDKASAHSSRRNPVGGNLKKPNKVSQNRLARDIDINPARVNDIVHGRSAITAPVALRLAKYFNTTPELWMNLQAGYELRKARQREWPKIEKRVRVLAGGVTVTAQPIADFARPPRKRDPGAPESI
ncbi:MAG: HigA family addiction module antitoxin [Xanthobacteraceae bacterium]